MTNSNDSDSRVNSRPEILLAIVFLCCVLLLPGISVAGNNPTGDSFQLQQTLNQLIGEDQAARYQKILSPDEPISWYVYLPNTNSTVKPGVMVYISPRETGQIDSRWRSVMDQQNMIYIAANDSGNRIPVNRRMVLAVMAIKALAQQHSFATDHIIVAGFSGGGRVASKLASQYPEVFTGSL